MHLTTLLLLLNPLLPLTSSHIDPRFQIGAQFSPHKLPGSSVFMNAIKALVSLSSNPMTAPFAGGDFSAYPYNDIEITIRPRTGAQTPFQIRHAEWGLDQAIYQLGKLRGFTESLFFLKWEDEVVGYLIFRRVVGGVVGESVRKMGVIDAPSLSSGDEDEAMTSSVIASSDDNHHIPAHAIAPRADQPPTIPPLTPRIRVIPTFIPNGATIPITDVFLSIMSALIHICEEQPSDTLMPFQSSPQNVNTWVRYQHFGHPPRPRTSAPFFENRYAAVALDQVAEWMLRQRRFADARWVVKVGGRDNVGVGMFKVGRFERVE